MKKTLIAVSLVSIFGLSHAQTAPVQGAAPAPAPVQAQVPMSNADLGAGAKDMNPYTGVSKAVEQSNRSLDDLKRQKDMSSQKLQLQRDELEALRIEVEKKKLADSINPPAPPVVKEPPKKIERPKPVVIYPEASKNEMPVLVGVVTSGGQRVAMFEHDGRPLRATVGSIIAGKRVEDISANNVRWGSQYLAIPAKKGYPTIALNDSEGPLERKKSATNQAIGGNAAPSAVPTSSSSVSPGATLPGTNIPMITPKGASNPSNIFGLLPPPPPGQNN